GVRRLGVDRAARRPGCSVVVSRHAAAARRLEQQGRRHRAQAMMQIAIPVVALGAGETVYRARDGRLYTTNATAVLGCSTQLSGRFQLRHTLGLFDAPGEHWAHDPADVDSAEHYRRCGDEFTHLL